MSQHDTDRMNNLIEQLTPDEAARTRTRNERADGIRRMIEAILPPGTDTSVDVVITPGVKTAAVLPAAADALLDADSVNLNPQQARQLVDQVDGDYLVLVTAHEAPVDRVDGVKDQRTVDRAHQYGLALHETLHILKTAIIEIADLIAEEVDDEYTDQFHDLFNIIEDGVIEYEAINGKTFPERSASRLWIVRQIHSQFSEDLDDEPTTFSFWDAVTGELYEIAILGDDRYSPFEEVDASLTGILVDPDDDRVVFESEAARTAFERIKPELERLWADVKQLHSTDLDSIDHIHDKEASIKRAQRLLETWQNTLEPLLKSGELPQQDQPRPPIGLDGVEQDTRGDSAPHDQSADPDVGDHSQPTTQPDSNSTSPNQDTIDNEEADSDGYECPDCEQSFDTDHGRRTHYGKKHGDTDKLDEQLEQDKSSEADDADAAESGDNNASTPEYIDPDDVDFDNVEQVDSSDDADFMTEVDPSNLTNDRLATEDPFQGALKRPEPFDEPDRDNVSPGDHAPSQRGDDTSDPDDQLGDEATDAASTGSGEASESLDETGEHSGSQQADASSEEIKAAADAQEGNLQEKGFDGSEDSDSVDRDESAAKETGGGQGESSGAESNTAPGTENQERTTEDQKSAIEDGDRDAEVADADDGDRRQGTKTSSPDTDDIDHDPDVSGIDTESSEGARPDTGGTSEDTLTSVSDNQAVDETDTSDTSTSQSKARQLAEHTQQTRDQQTATDGKKSSKTDSKNSLGQSESDSGQGSDETQVTFDDFIGHSSPGSTTSDADETGSMTNKPNEPQQRVSDSGVETQNQTAGEDRSTDSNATPNTREDASSAEDVAERGERDADDAATESDGMPQSETVDDGQFVGEESSIQDELNTSGDQIDDNGQSSDTRQNESGSVTGHQDIEQPHQPGKEQNQSRESKSNATDPSVTTEEDVGSQSVNETAETSDGEDPNNITGQSHSAEGEIGDKTREEQIDGDGRDNESRSQDQDADSVYGDADIDLDALETDRKEAEREAQDATIDKQALAEELAQLEEALNDDTSNPVRNQQDGGDGAGPGSLEGLSILPIDDGEIPNHEWRRIEQNAQQVGDTLANTLQLDRQSATLQGVSSGSYNPKTGYKLSYGDPNTFQREFPGDKKRYAVVFNLDRSGSMAEPRETDRIHNPHLKGVAPKIRTATTALVRSAIAFERLDVDVAVIDFYDNEARLVKPFSVEIEFAAPTLLRQETGGGTPLADALKLARNLVERQSNEPIIINITDDKPRSVTAVREQIKQTYAPVCSLSIATDRRADNPPPKAEELENDYYQQDYVFDPERLDGKLDQFASGLIGL